MIKLWRYLIKTNKLVVGNEETKRYVLYEKQHKPPRRKKTVVMLAISLSYIPHHNEMTTESSTQAQRHCNLLDDKEAVVRLGMEGKPERAYNQPTPTHL